MGESMQKTLLDNGIRVLSERMDGIRSVSVGAIIGVGSRDEIQEQMGYAHLLEHMLFQGTEERDARAIAEMMEIGGGAIGAFTTREYTVYHATVLDEYLPFALEVLGDMLGSSNLPEQALDRQRSVILAEIASHDDPLQQANNLLKESLWPGCSLGRPTIGNERSLNQATRESLLSFMQLHYTSDNLILAAAGSIQHEQMVDQSRDFFRQMQRRSAVPSHPCQPSSQLNVITAERRPAHLVYFALAWPAPAYTDPDRYSWHVFATLLGGGPTSRLYRVLREECGMVYHISAQYQAYESAGAVVIEGAARPEALVSVLAGSLIEAFKMTEPINLDNHYRATRSLISQHLVSGDSAYVRMSRLALQEYYFSHAITSDDVTQGLRAQSPKSIQEIAWKMLSEGLPATALVGPVSDELLEAVCAMFADFGEAPRLVLHQGTQPAISVPYNDSRKFAKAVESIS